MHFSTWIFCYVNVTTYRYMLKKVYAYHTFALCRHLVEQRQGLTNEQLESRCEKDRTRYTNMTYKHRQAICDHQNTCDISGCL